MGGNSKSELQSVVLIIYENKSSKFYGNIRIKFHRKISEIKAETNLIITAEEGIIISSVNFLIMKIVSSIIGAEMHSLYHLEVNVLIAQFYSAGRSQNSCEEKALRKSFEYYSCN